MPLKIAAGAFHHPTLRLATLASADNAVERSISTPTRLPYDSATVQLLREGYLEIAGGRSWPNPESVVGLHFPIPGDNPNTVVIQERRPYILDDAPRPYQFVAVFYGILDPATGRLTYSNAGHCPPLLFSAQGSSTLQTLGRTGTILGIIEDSTWHQRVVQLAPGDALVLYTDGVTEAQKAQGEFFGEDRLLEATRANLGQTAQEMQEGVLAEVEGFADNAPQSDYIPLTILTRGSAEE